ncbi:MAG: M6 family metalloprotease domain-containing protein [bacterium]
MTNKQLLYLPLLLFIFLAVNFSGGDSPPSTVHRLPSAIHNLQSEIQPAPYRELSRYISSMRAAPSISGGLRQYAPAKRLSPAVGEEKLLVILIEFSDVTHSAEHTPEYFDHLLFSKAPGDKSMWNYYQECSYGQFFISPGSEANNPTPWLRSDHTLAYYNDLEESNGAIWKLAEEALEKAAQAGVDFSSYDEDKNGLVDHLVVVHAGGAEEDTSMSKDLGSHRWEIKTTGQGYTLQAETSPMGIFAHEFGHDLGLPDLYIDSNHFLIYDWALMDHGAWLGEPPGSSPAHPCPWSKALLGWITPVEASSCGPVREVWAIEIHQQESLFRLSTANPKEYFLVSNHQRTSFDAYLPGEGILIWHIDDSIGCIECNDVNSNPFHPRVYLEQADGRDDLRHNGKADAGDPYSKTGAKDHFGVNTIPNSRDYNEAPTGIEIKVCDAPGEVMKVVMKRNCGEATENDCEKVTTKTYVAANPFVISQYPEGVGIYLEPAAANPTISIYDLNGELVHTETGGENVLLVDSKGKERWANKFPWDGRNEADREVASGVYVYIIETESKTMTGKLAVIR